MNQPTIRARVSALMAVPRTRARKKAIITIAKKHNISRTDAQFRQSVAIARTQSRKNP